MAGTIVELFDREPVENILAAVAFRPERVLYVGSEKMMTPQKKRDILAFFIAQGCAVDTRFYPVDSSDLGAILQTLEEIRLAYPDCVYDVTGGTDLALLAMGIFCERRRVPVFTFDIPRRRFLRVAACEQLPLPARPALSVKSLVALAGGAFTRHGRFFAGEDTEEMRHDILRVWNIFKSNQHLWPRMTSFFQQAKTGAGGLEVDSPLTVGEKARTRGDRRVLYLLYSAGILNDLRFTREGVRFFYKNENIRRCLSDAGIWLELYSYVAARAQGAFDDVQTSVVVDWDGVDDKRGTTNEIDLVAVKGISPLFLSCKTGVPSSLAVNEINTLKNQFGGRYARAALVTSTPIAQVPFSIKRRAADMGVVLFSAFEMDEGEYGAYLASLLEIP